MHYSAQINAVKMNMITARMIQAGNRGVGTKRAYVNANPSVRLTSSSASRYNLAAHTRRQRLRRYLLHYAN
jgi:hypothetical protein